MMDSFLLIALPYIALCACIGGSVYRLGWQRYSVSSLSSQFLEKKKLQWGSMPWHVGIILILLAHAVAIVFPSVWRSLMSQPLILLGTETLGIMFSIFCLAGLGVLIVRRLTSPHVQAVTSMMDLVVLALLFAQVLLGMLTALLFPYGAAWAPGTLVPYLWGLLSLHPDMSFVADFPPLIKLHLTGAWILIFLLPFTRLIHVLVIPLHYILRAPLVVIWSNSRKSDHALATQLSEKSRREFILGSGGVLLAASLLSMGALDKLIHFFKGTPGDEAVKTDLLEKKLSRLQQTAEERELELERQRNAYVLIGAYGELSETKGKYFIDYEMNPGLAFKGKNGLPLLISAKCTHLGCTVGSEINSDGHILCPCHVSYFNVATGMPNEGAPAKAPLKHIAWALMDGAGKIVAAQSSDGKLMGSVDPTTMVSCNIHIAKPESV